MYRIHQDGTITTEDVDVALHISNLLRAKAIREGHAPAPIPALPPVPAKGFTPPRKKSVRGVVLSVITEADTSLTTDEITDLVWKKRPGVSRQSIRSAISRFSHEGRVIPSLHGTRHSYRIRPSTIRETG